MSKGVPRLDGDQQIGSRKSYFTDLTDEQWVLVERLKVIFGDNKYRNHSLNAWLKSNRPQWTIEVQSPPVGTKGFIAVHKRWVVERTNGWHGRSRRINH